MIFGKEKNKGLKLNGFTPEVVTIGENGVTEDDILVHNEQDINNANMLCRLETGFPAPLGIIRKVDAPIYDKQVVDQINEVTEKKEEDQ